MADASVKGNMEQPSYIVDVEHLDFSKRRASHHEHETTHDAAEKGHVVTDKYGNALIEIDRAVETKLRHKIDLYVVPTVVLLYLFCFIDRTNIGNARLAGFEKDLGLKGYDYNTILSIFYISYILCELPGTMLCKYVGPGWFIPSCSLGFGITTVAFAFVRTKEQACAVRFLLGIFEAPMLPGIAYYLSRWYRRSELAFRLAMYIACASFAGAFGGLLASGILRLSHFGSTKRWEMIFAIEGIITIILSLISFLTLTDRPETARWLSQEEKDLAVARIKSERIATTEVLDKIDKKKMIGGILSPVTMMTSVIFLLTTITVQGVAFFAPTIVRTIYPKEPVVTQQLYTVPPYIVGALSCVLFNYLSTKIDRRNILMIICLPFVMVGYITFLATTNSQARYGATFIIAFGIYTFGALLNSQLSANVISDTARSGAIGIGVFFCNVGGLISTWSFLPFDGPSYPIGNGLNLATSAVSFAVAIGLEFWMKIDNKRREELDIDSVLVGMSEKGIQDLDWKHPGFRWKP
ncbi:hypothetical protein LTR05_008001 [Lithohypha guttulata]|uniref:Major facilitator superfamily (MFS) profile domain-containing protein n=1 Tax=Lithohypha guttulata TaxID=1690604 RepID=A0AAN7STM5_9EURO|nr:hypothetical protein LTR05_008001 [Lithohypha guttulata]